MNIEFNYGSVKLIALATLLIGCSGDESAGADSRKSLDENPSVVVSNYPLKYFAERIGGGEIEVQFLVPNDIDPAMWRPELGDVTAMQEADLILLNGASYESWLKFVSLPPSRIVDTTAPSADLLIPITKGVTHVHGLEGEHEHSGTAFTTWLDVQLAVGQMQAIADAYSERWPHLSATFQSATANLETELLALDSDLEQLIGRSQDLPVLFSHPVYQYFERRYSINGESVHWEPDETPDESMWADLEELVILHPAKWMVWESEPGPDIASRLQNMGITSVVFSTAANTPDQGDYLSTMEKNIANLTIVFTSDQ